MADRTADCPTKERPSESSRHRTWKRRSAEGGTSDESGTADGDTGNADDGSDQTIGSDDGDLAANEDGQPGMGIIGAVGAIGTTAYLLARRIGATGGDRE